MTRSKWLPDCCLHRGYICMMMAVCLWAMLACNDNRASENELRESISTIPMLYSVEAQVEVLVEGHGEDGAADWKAMFGKRDIILPVRANVKAGIDLSKIQDLQIEGDRVYLTLPEPVIEIESTEIPWGEVVSSVTGLRDHFTNKEKEFLTKKGKQHLQKQIVKLDILQTAQEHAEQILTNMLLALGYKPVFKTKPVYSEYDIIRFIKE